ncbi:MAG: flagellar M-ring protein FliF, partial [Desulfitobacterium sp.]|nr:flagellar M-ring protein FliF [Desulfitobacterium sp.]
MNFSWAEFKESIQKFWGKLSRPQKIITVAAPLVVAIALISLLIMASNPSYVTIFKNLSDAEAGEITAELKAMKVNYKLENNGRNILVPEKEAAEIRLALANEGLPQGSKFSWSESLDKMRVGETESDRRLRYILGLQTEIENALTTLSGVEYADVQLAMPEPTLFAEQQEDTTAAVLLKLAPDTQMTEDQVRAIANLLSASVEGLQLENVTISDTYGNLLSDVLKETDSPEKMTASQIELQNQIEENIRKSLQSMLDRAFGHGSTVVRANAILDFDQVKTNIETHGPGAIISESHTSENTINAYPGGTVPGVDTNVPGYEAVDGDGIVSQSEKTSDTINHQVDKTTEEIIRNQGDIRRLSVSVLVDEDKIGFEQLPQIEAIVEAAAGIDREERGDQLQVAALPFDKTNLLATEEALAEQARKEQMRRYIEWAIGAILALAFIFVLYRMRKRKVQEDTLQLEQELQPVPLAAAEELLLAQEEAEREAELRLAQQNQKT